MDIISDLEFINNQLKIHIRIIKRNNRQYKTYLENLSSDIDFKTILKKLKVYFNCNGNISTSTMDNSKIIILQGDHHRTIKEFLLNNGIINDINDVIIHAF